MKSPVESLVETAVRRHLLVSSLEQSALALAAVLGGTIFLLLLGTQILSWPWLLLLGALGLAVAFARLRRSLLPPYRVAQIVDRKIRSHDLLSTAWFLLRHPQPKPSYFADAQIAIAERLAPSIRPRTIFPVAWRRSWTLVCALAAVAFGLFALRYLLTRSLDLKYSLLPMPAISPAVALERLENLFAPHRDRNPEVADLAKLKLPETELPRDHEAPSRQAGKPASSTQSGQNATEKQTSASGSAKTSGQSPNPNAAPASSAQHAQKDAAGRSNHPSTSPQTPPSSLSDRMHDALSGLMEKMRSQSGASTNREQGGQQASNQNSGSNARDPQASENAPNSQTSGQSANRDQNAQSMGQPQATEKSAAAQSQSAAQGSSQKGSDSQSGIGRQDGEKTLREAEQLRAMGKLDEIIGKRSAALTGDMTVETRSTHQQLQTQYTGRVGHHSDSGGLIEHDEVPLALQDYVRSYMEQVHKQPEIR